MVKMDHDTTPRGLMQLKEHGDVWALGGAYRATTTTAVLQPPKCSRGGAIICTAVCHGTVYCQVLPRPTRRSIETQDKVSPGRKTTPHQRQTVTTSTRGGGTKNINDNARFFYQRSEWMEGSEAIEKAPNLSFFVPCALRLDSRCPPRTRCRLGTPVLQPAPITPMIKSSAQRVRRKHHAFSLHRIRTACNMCHTQANGSVMVQSRDQTKIMGLPD